MMFILLIILLCLIILGLLAKLFKSDGVLEIDISNVDKDNYCFKIDDLDKLKKKKRMHLKIVVKK